MIIPTPNMMGRSGEGRRRPRPYMAVAWALTAILIAALVVAQVVSN